MSDAQQAKVAGRALRCPVCDHNAFYTKNFYVQGKYMQALNLVPFGEEGLMLICERCSNIQHFARNSSVELNDIN